MNERQFTPMHLSRSVVSARDEPRRSRILRLWRIWIASDRHIRGTRDVAHLLMASNGSIIAKSSPRMCKNLHIPAETISQRGRLRRR